MVYYCVNPLKKEFHKSRKSSHKINLRMVEDAEKVNVILNEGEYIYSTCRIELFKMVKNIQVTMMELESEAKDTTDQLFEDPFEGPPENVIEHLPDHTFVVPDHQAIPRRPLPSTSAMALMETDVAEIDVMSPRNRLETTSTILSATSVESSSADEFMDDSAALNALNESIRHLNQSPIQKAKLRYASYSKQKNQSIKDAIGRKIFGIESDEEQNGIEMLAQLQEKFADATKKEKMLILTTLPRSWSEAKIVANFPVSRYIAKTAKYLQVHKRVMLVAEIKLGSRTLSDETVEIVKQFYREDDNSQV